MGVPNKPFPSERHQTELGIPKERKRRENKNANA
jgi:hypothetical protein